ncbi:MAG: ribonuclease PH [Planctomycetes bacterium]|nr:ribonuclease PH [Planctomycetota bacterium]
METAAGRERDRAGFRAGDGDRRRAQRRDLDRGGGRGSRIGPRRRRQRSGADGPGSPPAAARGAALPRPGPAPARAARQARRVRRGVATGRGRHRGPRRGGAQPAGRAAAPAARARARGRAVARSAFDRRPARGRAERAAVRVLRDVPRRTRRDAPDDQRRARLHPLGSRAPGRARARVGQRTRGRPAAGQRRHGARARGRAPPGREPRRPRHDDAAARPRDPHARAPAGGPRRRGHRRAPARRDAGRADPRHGRARGPGPRLRRRARRRSRPGRARDARERAAVRRPRRVRLRRRHFGPHVSRGHARSLRAADRRPGFSARRRRRSRRDDPPARARPQDLRAERRGRTRTGRARRRAVARSLPDREAVRRRRTAAGARLGSRGLLGSGVPEDRPLARKDNRPPEQTRPTRFTRSFTDLPGSVLSECGNTKVLCTVSIQEQVPIWMANRHAGGWLTAEYAMLPGAGQPRKPRDGRTGRPPDGRSLEIQRLIGRALRSSLDLAVLPEMTFWIDCDVIQADGGTRTTAINGAAVALYDALLFLEERRQLPTWPLRGLVAATSVGLVDGEPLIDLDYREDSSAEVDLNVVTSDSGNLIEIQGAAEKKPFSNEQLQTMLGMATNACVEIRKVQKQALGLPDAAPADAQ